MKIKILHQIRYSDEEFVAQWVEREGDLSLVAVDLGLPWEEVYARWRELVDAGVNIEEW